MEKPFHIRHAASLQLFWFFLNGLIILSQQFTFSLKDITDFFHFLYFMSGRLMMIPIILYFGTILEERSYAQLGLTPKEILSNMRLGIRLNLPLLAMVLFFINIPLSSQSTSAFKPLIYITRPTELGVSLLYLIPLFCVALLPALAEELLYRGVLWPIFRKYFGIYFGIFLHALYYAFIFFDFQREIFLIKFCVGLICGILYYRTQSLVAPVTFQALYHSIFILYIFGFHYW